MSSVLIGILLGLVLGILLVKAWEKWAIRVLKNSFGRPESVGGTAIATWLNTLPYDRLIKHRDIVEAEIKKRQP